MWHVAADANFVHCKVCADGARKPGWWTCFAAGCKQKLPQEAFVLARQKNTAAKLQQAKNRLCDDCIKNRAAAEAKIRADNIHHVTQQRQ